ncbi:MAG: ribonuclease H-like domain-containing protein [Deltaproteobacteria bacterium]|nr:ribonuclease H-like domain-containing protein [Deltaproteobacteria bacterium]
MMGIKERLERLETRSGAKRQARDEIVSDLKKRLERLARDRRIVAEGKKSRPVEELIGGQEVATPHGKTLMREETYGSGYRHGGMLLDRILEIPTDSISVVSRDESLVGLDFSRTLFIDVETTGLAGGTGTCAFLVGVGFFEGGRFITRQFFLRDFSEERAMLWLLGKLAARFRFLVTFNGKRFDVPVLETRFVLSQMENPLRDLPNHDLLFPSMRIWRGAYGDCRLATLESHVLDIQRHDDIPSEMIPYVYFDYLRTGDGNRIQRVFYHNRMDVLSLVTLAGRIHELVHAPQTASKREWVEPYAVGRLLSNRKRTGEAIGCFHHALRICKDSGEWEILKHLSLAMKRERQMEGAVSLWKEMVSLDGSRGLFPYEELGKYYEHHAKDYQEALRWVREASGKLRDLSMVEREALQRRYRRLLSKKSGGKDSGEGVAEISSRSLPPWQCSRRRVDQDRVHESSSGRGSGCKGRGSGR